MYNLTGFIQIAALVDNTADAVSTVGELSAKAESYSRDKLRFRQTGQVELIVFTSKEDDEKIDVDAEYYNHILTLTQWVYDQAIAGTTTNDQDAFQRLLLSKFSDTIDTVATGTMVAENQNWFPEYISWNYSAKDSNRITVYFTSDSFESNYTDYEIVVVPPISPVDTFMSVQSKVEEALAEFNVPDLTTQVNEASEDTPYTYIKSENFTWQDQEDETATLKTVWTVLVWGQSGVNPTHIKNAIRDYILENSGYAESNWVKVFPEIFTTTKFTFVPGYSIRGLPNKTDSGSLYYPMLPYEFINKAAGKFLDLANPITDVQKIADSDQDIVTMPIAYKSLGMVVIAGPENREGYKTLNDLWPDYANISTSSPDIANVSNDTSAWIRNLIEAIIAAEEYYTTELSDVITKMTDEDDETINYFVFSENNVEYRVVTRSTDWEAAVDAAATTTEAS